MLSSLFLIVNLKQKFSSSLYNNKYSYQYKKTVQEKRKINTLTHANIKVIEKVSALLWQYGQGEKMFFFVKLFPHKYILKSKHDIFLQRSYYLRFIKDLNYFFI